VKQTILSLGLVLAFTSAVCAQQATAPAAPAVPTRVAVVDVAQLIKAHPDFKAKQEALQAQVKDAEGRFQARQKGIQDKQKALEGSNAKPGTQEHQKMLDEIASDLADFEKDAKQQQRKFALENSRIMYETYQDIKKVIKVYAQERAIAQVTDFRAFEPNPAEPQSVAEDMDQKLVWFDERLDITKFIIRSLYAARNLPVPAQTATAPQAMR
jgi:Skp family chaperone for outer membrane proteins